MIARVAALLLVLIGCVSNPEGVRSGTALDVANASAMSAAELAKGPREAVLLGWNLEVTGDRARFFECTAENVCGIRRVEIPAASLTSMKIVARTHPRRADGSDAEETDVVRLTVTRDVKTSRGGFASDPHRGLTVGGPTR